ncbi:MAG: iron-siderophore ABC transporter substrate-binding protein [Actinomycetota bacterium]|nr:iron-siderophore ABC transporter substrate-binding protein [Actinomycetota bacterium]
MRRLLALLLLTGMVGLTAACGDDSDGAQPVAAATADDDAAFPVTIEHAYGSTTIEQEPERIVTVGFTDADMLLALGVVPVGLQRWYGEHEHGVWPWAEELLGDAEPVVLEGESLNFEAIAELEPDLILGLYAGLEPDEYDTLAAIAPTVAQSGEHLEFGTPWQEMTRTAGLAVGKADDADALVDEVSELFAAVRAEHPEFQGIELAYAGVYGEGQYYVETEGSTRVQILLDLGFVVPDELAALGDDSFYHDISAEMLALLDQEVVLWEPADISQLPAVEANPLYQNLAVAREDREVFLDDPLIAAAMAHSSVLSLPVVLEALVPALADAVRRR